MFLTELRCSLVVLLILALANISTDSNAALLLQYGFDEASGETALDTGNTLPPSDGTLTGGAARTTNTPGPFSAFALDLTNDDTYAHVLGEDAAKLDGLGQLTLTTWLNVSQYTSGNNRLSAKQAGGNFGGFSWNMNATPNSGDVGPDNFRLAIFLGNNVSSGGSDFAAGFSTADVDADNKWVFLAFTYDNALASENAKFYIGGVGTPVTQLGDALTLPQLTIEGGTSRYGVGFTDAAPAANTSVVGFQDDVRVYDNALSLADLEEVRQSVIPEPTSVMLLIAGGLVLFACGIRRRAH